jgi:hypothetical protein
MSKLYKPGTFLRLPLPDGRFAYGRTLEPPFDAFYDYTTEDPDSDLDRIGSKAILFKVAVRHDRRSAWVTIGRRPLDERLLQPAVYFSQALGDFRRCTIFDTAGNSRSAEPHECVGLEQSTVWEPQGIERRLLDAFMGRPNITLERLKVRLE